MIMVFLHNFFLQFKDYISPNCICIVFFFVFFYLSQMYIVRPKMEQVKYIAGELLFFL